MICPYSPALGTDVRSVSELFSSVSSGVCYDWLLSLFPSCAANAESVSASLCQAQMQVLCAMDYRSGGSLSISGTNKNEGVVCLMFE